MRLIIATTVLLIGTTAFAISAAQSDSARAQHDHGQAIFRFDTFGDEQLWTDVLRMQEAIAAVAPVTALAVGLKVDREALPRELIAALRAGDIDLTSPAVTIALLRLNAVVGVKGTVNRAGQLTTAAKRVFCSWGPESTTRGTTRSTAPTSCR